MIFPLPSGFYDTYFVYNQFERKRLNDLNLKASSFNNKNYKNKIKRRSR